MQISIKSELRKSNSLANTTKSWLRARKARARAHPPWPHILHRGLQLALQGLDARKIGAMCQQFIGLRFRSARIFQCTQLDFGLFLQQGQLVIFTLRFRTVALGIFPNAANLRFQFALLLRHLLEEFRPSLGEFRFHFRHIIGIDFLHLGAGVIDIEIPVSGPVKNIHMHRGATSRPGTHQIEPLLLAMIATVEREQHQADAHRQH